MKRLASLALLCGCVLISSAGPSGQTGLKTGALGQPPTDSWPSYNGDYTGRRYSTLNKITAANVQNLSLAWLYRVNPGQGAATTIKGTPLQVNGIVYLTIPDHVLAIDART